MDFGVRNIFEVPLRPARGLIGRARHVGEEAVQLFFANPGFGEMLAADAQLAKNEVEECLDPVMNSMTRERCTHLLSLRAVELLRTPHEDLSEDDYLRLKKIGFALGEVENFSAARAGLDEADAGLLGAYLGQLLGE